MFYMNYLKNYKIRDFFRERKELNMREYKIRELYKLSKHIINMLEVLGLDEYKEYRIVRIFIGNYLANKEVLITDRLSNSYNDLYLVNLRTNTETMKKFEYDINSDYFDELEKLYIEFIK